MVNIWCKLFDIFFVSFKEKTSMANIWCKLLDVFFVSFKKKRWKDFLSHRKCYDLVLMMFMLVVLTMLLTWKKYWATENSNLRSQFSTNSNVVWGKRSLKANVITIFSPHHQAFLLPPQHHRHHETNTLILWCSVLQLLLPTSVPLPSPCHPDLPASAFSSHRNSSSISGWFLCQFF